MAGEHLEAHSRVVVTGVNDSGKSVIVRDGDTAARVATEAYTINQIWQVDSLPPHVLAEDTSGGEASIAPPASGFVYLVTTWPPDSEWDMAAGYEAALAASGDAEAHVEGSAVPGMHQTDTVDIVTVISGELTGIVEDGEVTLKAGDSFVQRGTKHSWSNRTDKPATIVAVMMTATR